MGIWWILLFLWCFGSVVQRYWYQFGLAHIVLVAPEANLLIVFLLEFEVPQLLQNLPVLVLHEDL